MSYLKQAIFGVKNCSCNRRRADGFHNIDCESWKNSWFYKKKIRTLIINQKANQ